MEVPKSLLHEKKIKERGRVNFGRTKFSSWRFDSKTSAGTDQIQI